MWFGLKTSVGIALFPLPLADTVLRWIVVEGHNLFISLPGDLLVETFSSPSFLVAAQLFGWSYEQQNQTYVENMALDGCV